MQANCGACGEECEARIVDNGIGPYEFWGSKETQHIYEVESDCCDANCTDENGLEITTDDIKNNDEAERDYG